MAAAAAAAEDVENGPVKSKVWFKVTLFICRNLFDGYIEVMISNVNLVDVSAEDFKSTSILIPDE